MECFGSQTSPELVESNSPMSDSDGLVYTDGECEEVPPWDLVLTHPPTLTPTLTHPLPCSYTHVHTLAHTMFSITWVPSDS